MGKYLLGIITALIVVAALVIWFSRPGTISDTDTPASSETEKEG